jgi:hypothetical protein
VKGKQPIQTCAFSLSDVALKFIVSFKSCSIAIAALISLVSCPTWYVRRLHSHPSVTNALGNLASCLTENKLEKIVENIVLTLIIAVELEGLGEVHGVLLLVDEKSASDEDNDTSLVVGGLSIESRDLVLDLLERKADKLLSDSLGAENGSGLKCEHGVRSVESSQTLAIRVEGVVVELDELLGDVLKVLGHLEIWGPVLVG